MLFKRRKDLILARLDRIDLSIHRRLDALFSAIRLLSLNIQQEISQMNEKLDAVLDAIAGEAKSLSDQITSLGNDLTQTISDLEAKVAAGSDVSAEIERAQTIADGFKAVGSSLDTLDQRVKAADPNQPPAPTPPAETPKPDNPDAPAGSSGS